MMQIRKPKHFKTVEIQMPGSKSESNRALIIQAIATNEININNLSNSDDSIIIQTALQHSTNKIDCKQSGAALRFLCAYYASKPGSNVILTGSERLKERPLKILVDALVDLGADIEYLGNYGYADIRIIGKKLISHRPITIQANVSSQFISALLMISPVIENGLQLHLENDIISESYIKMTLQMMRKAKIHVIENDKSIIIPEQEYQSCTFNIEGDWTSASYWYGLVSLGIPSMRLNGLYKKSLQADSILSEWMQNWYVDTVFDEKGIVLKHNDYFKPNVQYNFSDCPDIAQTIIVLAALHQFNIKFNGVESLIIKETNRIEALKNELQKMNVQWNKSQNYYEIITSAININTEINIKTYHDHRMAMSFVLLAMLYEEINIDDEKVVSKSYPNFWNDIETLGFTLNRNK